jgi:hypothetical protein
MLSAYLLPTSFPFRAQVKLWWLVIIYSAVSRETLVRIEHTPYTSEPTERVEQSEQRGMGSEY